MNKILAMKEKVLKISFLRFFRRFVPLSIAIVLLGGIVVGFGLKTQIVQTVGYLQELEHNHGEIDFLEDAPITELSNGMEAAVGAYAGICLLLFAVFWIFVAAWLYKKAVLSKMNGLPWLLIGLVSNVFGVVLFFIARSVIRSKCTFCGTWQNKNNRFCTACGAELSRICNECHELCKPDDHYCSRCGSSLDKKDDAGNR